ncbi:MAG TPA: hypothetical protein VFI73_09560 [Candidatus Nitrosopolaris sp.]|nr:hypothetical protein [Candidatus Nitrosopolaris sp.]
MMYLRSFRSLLIELTIAQGNLPFKSLRIISIISLTFLLLISVPGKLDILALSNGGGGHSLGAAGGGFGGGSGGPISGSQPNSIGGGPRSGLNPNTNCMGTGTGILVPSATNCANPNSIPPTNAANSDVVQPSNCNAPASVHHTNALSPAVAHSANCPPPSSGTSNSLTVNNVQSSSSSGSTTPTQSTTIPVANAGSNQKVHSSDHVTLDGSKSYAPNGHSLTFSWLQLAGGPVVTLSNDNMAKATFTAPLVKDTTNLTFQLIVNNGNDKSSPSFVSITVTP